MKDRDYCLLVFLLTAVGQVLFFLLSETIIHLCFAETNGHLPFWVKTVISCIISGAAAVSLSGAGQQVKKFLRRCVLLCLVLLLAETVLFNFKSMTTDYSAQMLRWDNVKIDDEFKDLATVNKNGTITLQNSSEIGFVNLPEDFEIGAIEMTAFQPEGSRTFWISVRMCDDNFTKQEHNVAERKVGSEKFTCHFSLAPYGKLRTVKFYFGEVQESVTIYSIRVMSHIPYHFSAIRFFILLVIGLLVTAIRTFRFYRVVYDRKKLWQRMLAAAMVALCVSTSFFFYTRNQELFDYPMEVMNEYTDPYALTFDAFQNHQTFLNIPVDENLEKLENVYEANLRGESGYAVAWDRAYYQGKYYSYFGITPLIVLHYPIYFFTGKLPTIETICNIFSTLMILFTCLAVLAAVRMFVPKANLLLLLLSLAGVTVLCGAYYCLQYPAMKVYTVAESGGVAFTSLTCWLGLRAGFTERKKLRMMLLALCGIAFGLAVGARPSTAICALVLAPVFLGILLCKDTKISYRIQQAASFLIPAGLCIGGLLIYNYLRFDDFLEFGARYQLTVSDIHANHLRFSSLFPTIYHYFLQPFGMSTVFPFISMPQFYLSNYEMFVYQSPMIGVLVFPMLVAGMLYLPSALQGKHHTLVQKRCRNGFFILCFVLALLIAWVNFSLGGLCMRYSLDMMPVLLMGSVCTILTISRRAGTAVYKISVASIIGTLILMFLLLLTDNVLTLGENYPDLYTTAEDLMIFWH